MAVLCALAASIIAEHRDGCRLLVIAQVPVISALVLSNLCEYRHIAKELDSFWATFLFGAKNGHFAFIDPFEGVEATYAVHRF